LLAGAHAARLFRPPLTQLLRVLNAVRQGFIALVSGLLFGAGLVISGMT
jgi:hypothetical protein